MNSVRVREMDEVGTRARRFLQSTADLYVEMLVRGRQTHAASLLQAIVLTMAHLRAIEELPAGAKQAEGLRKASRVLERISMLVIYLAATDTEPSSALALETIDAAADLSGALRSAALAEPPRLGRP